MVSQIAENEEDGRSGVMRSIEHSRRMMKYWPFSLLPVETIQWGRHAVSARWQLSPGQTIALLVRIRKESVHAVVARFRIRVS